MSIAQRRASGVRLIGSVLLLLTAGALIAVPHTVRAQSTMQVQISGFAFHPASLTITPGSTVTWTNMDSVAHTSTSDTSAGVQWDSGPLASGSSFSKTFTQPGTYTYHCSFHANMHGTIIVQAAGSGAPAATPTVTSTTTPALAASPAVSHQHAKTVDATEVNNRYVFKSKKMTITVGTKVVWKNISDALHTVTSASGRWHFNKHLGPGNTVSYRFEAPGTYHYFCAFHAGMKGVIVVKK